MSEENIQWHPAFAAALKLELKEYYPEVIDIEEEHQLTSKPLEIDIIVIKKLKKVEILNNIGKVFREHNIIEYKSPDDYLSIDDYYKVKAYAYLYKSLTQNEDKIKIGEMTITMVSNRFPKKMVQHIQESQKVDCQEQDKGIYYIIGEDVPVQLIVIDELPSKVNRYIRLLSKTLNIKNEIEILIDEYMEDSKNNEYELLMDTVSVANFDQLMEVFEMTRTLTQEQQNRLDKVVSKMGLDKKWEVRGKLEGILEGKLEGKLEVAKKLIVLGLEFEKIVEATGLSEDEIKKLIH